MQQLSVRELRRFLALDAKRRSLANAIYYGLRMGVAETEIKGTVAVDLAASIAGDAAQDVLNQLRARSVTAVHIESVRKSVQYSAA